VFINYWSDSHVPHNSGNFKFCSFYFIPSV